MKLHYADYLEVKKNLGKVGTYNQETKEMEFELDNCKKYNLQTGQGLKFTIYFAKIDGEDKLHIDTEVEDLITINNVFNFFKKRKEDNKLDDWKWVVSTEKMETADYLEKMKDGFLYVY